MTNDLINRLFIQKFSLQLLVKTELGKREPRISRWPLEIAVRKRKVGGRAENESECRLG